MPDREPVTYFVICPECDGRRVVNRGLCWKCLGEGGFNIPETAKVPVSRLLWKVCKIAIWAAVLLGIASAIVGLSSS